MRDLTDQRFGMLVALSVTEERKYGYVVWDCRCDCGNHIHAASIELIKGRKRSCGCMQKDWGTILWEPHKKDITGQTFGLLTAIRPTEKRKKRSVVWECWCECGNTVFESVMDLMDGKKRSCGCLHQAHIAQYGASRAKDLTGQRFGRLTAIRPTEKRSGNAIVWECMCDCGNTTFTSRNGLTSGEIRSCGCLRKELTIERNKSRKKVQVCADEGEGERNV